MDTTRNPRMPGQWGRLTSALVLAVCVHAVLAGMILVEADWHTSESFQTPVLDLSPLAVNMVMQNRQKMPLSSPASVQVPVRMVPDEAHVGAGRGRGNDMLRLVRRQINAAWQPAQAKGFGRALVVLSINRQGRIRSSRMVQMQGNEPFATFMKTFVADLEAVDFSIPDEGHDIRVECEFSVGE